MNTIKMNNLDFLFGAKAGGLITSIAMSVYSTVVLFVSEGMAIDWAELTSWVIKTVVTIFIGSYLGGYIGAAGKSKFEKRKSKKEIK